MQEAMLKYTTSKNGKIIADFRSPLPLNAA
jgi:hypothetical protein